MALQLKSVEFRREREGSWHELEQLVARVDRDGIRGLTAAELSRLPILYRAALSSLSVARAISLDQNLLDYLESLVGRAYFCVYGTRRDLGSTLWRYLSHDFPRAVREARWSIALSAVIMLAGVLTALFLTANDPDRFYSFVSPEYAQGRGPATSTEDLRAQLYDDGGGAVEALTLFASSLFSHNASIGILAFALGVALGVPVFFLMFVNGLVLGAFAGLYHTRGLSVDLWGWLLPHGVTELTAVILCGGAGLVLAHSIVFPGRYSRLDNLARRGRLAGQVVVGAVIMLFCAGLIEGLFRQLVQSVPVRYAVATATAVFWLGYFGFAGRRAPAPERES